MYYQGGGACWNGTSCWVANTFKNFARVRECVGGDNPGTDCTLQGDAACTGGGTCGPYFSEDNPDLVGTGFADSSDPDNPFKEWHIVFVTYCTGDVHWGNAFGAYGPGQGIQHRGRINAMVAEKFAREHFPNPEEVFVTGSSAGSYGALFNSAFLMDEVYPASEFNVLGDAGIGVITKGWLEDSFGNWGVDGTLPKFIPALDVPANTLSMPDVIAALANYFPQHHFASYQTAYDGSGGGQSAFFNVMRNPSDVLPVAALVAEHLRLERLHAPVRREHRRQHEQLPLLHRRGLGAYRLRLRQDLRRHDRRDADLRRLDQRHARRRTGLDQPALRRHRRRRGL